MTDLFKFKHGLKRHPLYDVWGKIKERCFKKTAKDYKHYGGRGITVCEVWINDFLAFYNWAIDAGWKKGLEIDRVENDGPYCPDNCRFVTRSQNMRNTRRNNMVTYRGETKALIEWAEITGINRYTLFGRIFKYGWAVDLAMETPVGTTYNGQRKIVSN